jgi:hypothetical protein
MTRALARLRGRLRPPVGRGQPCQGSRNGRRGPLGWVAQGWVALPGWAINVGSED